MYAYTMQFIFTFFIEQGLILDLNPHGNTHDLASCFNTFSHLPTVIYPCIYNILQTPQPQPHFQTISSQLTFLVANVSHFSRGVATDNRVLTLFLVLLKCLHVQMKHYALLNCICNKIGGQVGKDPMLPGQVAACFWFPVRICDPSTPGYT